MKKTNSLKKFTFLTLICTGLITSLTISSQVKADYGYAVTQEQAIDTYHLSGPGGYYGNGTTSRIGNMTIDNYYDNYGSISCTTTNIGFMTTVNCY